MERNKNEWNVSNLICKQYGWNGMESFYNNIILDPYFKIKGWICRGILGVLVKK